MAFTGLRQPERFQDKFVYLRKWARGACDGPTASWLSSCGWGQPEAETGAGGAVMSVGNGRRAVRARAPVTGEEVSRAGRGVPILSFVRWLFRSKQAAEFFFSCFFLLLAVPVLSQKARKGGPPYGTEGAQSCTYR
jgi:hypothetical protein